MDDDTILQRGGTQYDIEDYAESNGATPFISERERILALGRTHGSSEPQTDSFTIPVCDCDICQQSRANGRPEVGDSGHGGTSTQEQGESQRIYVDQEYTVEDSGVIRERLGFSQSNSPTLSAEQINYYMDVAWFSQFGISKVKEPKEEKQVNVMPRKMNVIKEWSISARALRRVIQHACRDDSRYDYKFSAVWDDRYKMFKIWNVKTNNIICTIKKTNDKIVIRYRQNSYYSSVMSTLENKNIKIVTIASDKLSIHRGNSGRATRNCSDTAESQLALRMAMYQEAMRKGKND